MIDLRLGNNLEVLKTLPDNSVDSIVTDPPYGLSFMNKKWDYDVPSTELWQECYRVLKPGGHLLSFSGSRTYHRMAVRIEDAGFEIRDQIMWVYGSGFPKSLNVGKAVDKLLGNEREVVGVSTNGMSETAMKPDKGWNANSMGKEIELTKGTSEWEGWGTALKPAHEPIVLARKPLSEKSVAENVLKWGTGGINIDECRIGTDGGTKRSHQANEWPLNEDGTQNRDDIAFAKSNHNVVELNEGRWPANIIFDEEAGQVLDQQSGISKSTIFQPVTLKNNTLNDGRTIKGAGMFAEGKILPGGGYSDTGGASRFFYCPKANKKDRDEGLDGFEGIFSPTMGDGIGMKEHNPDTATPKKNHHPTVKPTALMEYLIKLITPVNGIVMDPFMGSGSTGKAAARNGFKFIGMEREKEYYKIAEARINYANNN